MTFEITGTIYTNKCCQIERIYHDDLTISYRVIVWGEQDANELLDEVNNIAFTVKMFDNLEDAEYHCVDATLRAE